MDPGGTRAQTLPRHEARLREEIVASFRDRLKRVAGFSLVADPLPMRNGRNAIAIVYYLFFASANQTRPISRLRGCPTAGKTLIAVPL